MLRKYGKKYSEDFIVNYYKNNLVSIRKMAKDLDISPDEIRYFLNKNNIHKKQSPGDFDEYRKHHVNKEYFDVINTEDKAYFLGLIYADGYVPDWGFAITLKEEDKYILETLCKYIGFDLTCIKQIKTKERESFKARTYYRLTISSVQIAKKLHEYGAIEKKSLVLQPPKNIPEKMLKHFVRGFIDGNGSIIFDVNTKSFRVQIASTLSMTEWLRDFFGGAQKIKKGKNVFYYCVGGTRKSYELLSKIYENSSEDLRLKRKYQKFLECKEKYEYQEKHRKETWINNLGPYIRNDMSGDCELSDQQV